MKKQDNNEKLENKKNSSFLTPHSSLKNIPNPSSLIKNKEVLILWLKF